LARPRHDWWMLSEAGETTHVRGVRLVKQSGLQGRESGTRWIAAARLATHVSRPLLPGHPQ
jgi:hypothetical protein